MLSAYGWRVSQIELHAGSYWRCDWQTWSENNKKVKHTRSPWEIFKWFKEETRLVDSLTHSRDAPCKWKRFCGAKLLHSCYTLSVISLYSSSIPPSVMRTQPSIMEAKPFCRAAVSRQFEPMCSFFLRAVLTAVRMDAHHASHLPSSARGGRCTLTERRLFTSLHLINISTFTDNMKAARGGREGTSTRE